jgi:hypothetical protein
VGTARCALAHPTLAEEGSEGQTETDGFGKAPINGLFRSAAQNELVRCENFLEAAYSRHEKVGSDSALAQTALESRGAGRSGFTRRLRAILAGASCALALAYCFIPTSKWMTPKLILPLLGPSMVTFIPSSSSAPARA